MSTVPLNQTKYGRDIKIKLILNSQKWTYLIIMHRRIVNIFKYVKHIFNIQNYVCRLEK